MREQLPIIISYADVCTMTGKDQWGKGLTVPASQAASGLAFWITARKQWLQMEMLAFPFICISHSLITQSLPILMHYHLQVIGPWLAL